MRVVAAGDGVHLRIFGECQSKKSEDLRSKPQDFLPKKLLSSTPSTAATKAHIFLLIQ